MRVCLIIDAGYMASIQRKIGAIDFLKLKNLIEEKYGKVVRGYYITSLDTNNQASFHSWIKSANGPKLEVVVKDQKAKSCPSCGNLYNVEKGIDVAISTLAIKGAHRDVYDTLALINGDGDLLDALQYVRDDLGREVIIVGELESISTDLQALASGVLSLPDYIQEIGKI